LGAQSLFDFDIEIDIDIKLSIDFSKLKACKVKFTHSAGSKIC
jgi:hypothetical protein